MTERYCIAMMNISRQKERYTLPLILTGKDEALVVSSLDDAVKLAKDYKSWHPEVKFEIFEYFEHSHFAYQLFEYGTWMIGKKSLATI